MVIMRNVLTLTVALIVMGATLPQAAAGGVAACDIVATKCSGAAAGVTQGCARGTVNLGILGGPKDFEVCVNAAGSASAATSIGIAATLAISATAFGTGEDGSGTKRCVKQEEIPLELYWLMIVCGAAASGKCVGASATAQANNAFGHLPLAFASTDGVSCSSHLVTLACKQYGTISDPDGVVVHVVDLTGTLDLEDYRGTAACPELQDELPFFAVELRETAANLLYESVLENFITVGDDIEELEGEEYENATQALDDAVVPGDYDTRGMKEILATTVRDEMLRSSTEIEYTLVYRG